MKLWIKLILRRLTFSSSQQPGKDTLIMLIKSVTRVILIWGRSVRPCWAGLIPVYGHFQDVALQTVPYSVPIFALPAPWVCQSLLSINFSSWQLPQGKIPPRNFISSVLAYLHTNRCPQILPVQVAICKEEHLKTFYNIADFRKRVGLKYFFPFVRIEFCCIISHSFLYEPPMSFCFRCTLWNKASENM